MKKPGAKAGLFDNECQTLEEILMKGATHNLVVRTRTDVALYVLNHKRGHLRDLENGFKVTLSVIADPSVSGPQAYVIDRGEQVHTLEAAKALLVAQAAASPPPLAEEYDDEELDAELESDVETEETEGLVEEQAAGDAAPEQDGQRRKRRRRRRGRGSQREGELREDTPPTLPEPAMLAGEGDEDAEAETEGEDGEEQPGQARGEQQGGGERRRRRGRRGGRRRRGGAEEGLAGSIADEIGTHSAPEAFEAVADFDGPGREAAPSLPSVEYAAEPQAPQPEPPVQQQAVAPAPAAAPAPVPTDEEVAEEKAAARRRSTVREKVSFLQAPASEQPAPDAQAVEPVATPSPAPEPAPAAAAETPAAPRRAGWWSRRFGGGE
jgi:ribonuclease E